MLCNSVVLKGEMMGKRFFDVDSSKKIHILILIGFCVILYFVNLGRWDLWNPDEPRYAQVSREMVDRGDWILMHDNGEVYADKPPLFFWFIAFSSYLGHGFTSFSVRFPAALFGTLTILLTFLLGKTLYSSRTGLLSGLVLATSFEFAYLSTRADTDTTLTFFTTASIFCFFQWYLSRQKEGSGQGSVRRLSIYGFYLGMALATLVKGPVGFILPLLVSLIYLIFQKDWQAMRAMKLLPGMLLMIGIVLCWYLPAVAKGGKDYLQATLLQQSIGRYSTGFAKVRPFYYYFVNFPGDFLPWFLFLPGAIVYGFSVRRERLPKEFLFLLIWFISIFAFFSFSKGKRPLYLLPLYPAVSLLVGHFWDAHLSDSNGNSIRRTWVSLPAYMMASFVFLVGIGLWFLLSVANVPIDSSAPRLFQVLMTGVRTGGKYLSYVPAGTVFFFVFLLLGSGLFLGLADAFKRKSLVFLIIVATVGIGFFYATRVIFPVINPYKSARFMSQEILQHRRAGEKLAVYGKVGAAPFNFYTGIVPILEIDTEEGMIEFFRSTERVFCLLRYRDSEMLSKAGAGISFQMIARRGRGMNEDDDVVLVSNR
jgi:4-amino-4-deoxy-L-arabinose transferase-like glycosyltransferase